MGPEPAVNAVFFNKIQAIEDPDERAAFVAEQRAEYEADVDLVRLAAELVVDAVVEPDELRAELDRPVRAGAARGCATTSRAATASRPSESPMPWCDDCDRYLAPSAVTHRRHLSRRAGGRSRSVRSRRRRGRRNRSRRCRGTSSCSPSRSRSTSRTASIQVIGWIAG